MDTERLTKAELELIEQAERDLAAQEALEPDTQPIAPAKVDALKNWSLVDTSTGKAISQHDTRQQARDNKARWKKERIAVGLDPSTLKVKRSAARKTLVAPSDDTTPAADDSTPKEPTAQTSRVTKKQQAIQIWNEQVAAGDTSRKTVLKRLMDEIGLSKDGGSTYHANLKTGKWV